ncbi:hypothetical protein MBANPS3_009839 [Mucor bainieri]
MFDVATGDAVHVDLNLVLGKGEDLPVPEIVPFRLTRNLTHAMGPLQAEGLFKATCETTMAVLLRNKDYLYSVLFETLLNELNATEPLRHTQRRTEKIMGTLQTRFSMDRRDVNKKVQELIDPASSPDKLALMFPGWTSYV